MLSKSRRPQWSKPPGLPCRRSRRQSNTTPNGTGVPTPSGPQDCALHLNPPRRVGAAQRVRPLFSISVFSVVCFSPCPPCPLWFAFSVPSHPTPSLQPNLAECTAQRFRSLFSHLRVLRGLFFSVSSVSSVVCFFRSLPTPSHNLPQIFFPLLFNHFPTRPFSSSCSPLVC